MSAIGGFGLLIQDGPDAVALGAEQASEFRGAFGDLPSGSQGKACTDVGAGDVCQANFGDNCDFDGDGCITCDTPGDAEFRKCQVSENSTCNRGGGPVFCGEEQVGTCSPAAGGFICVSSPGGTCNSAGSVKNQCI